MPEADDTERPSWLTSPCPPWCTRAHGEDDHPEDRYHQSEPTIVAAVAGTGDAVPLTASLHPVSLAVRAGRYADDDLTWLVVEALEDRRPRIVLSLDSARALSRGLQTLLGEIDTELEGPGDLGVP